MGHDRAAPQGIMSAASFAGIRSPVTSLLCIDGTALFGSNPGATSPAALASNRGGQYALALAPQDVPQMQWHSGTVALLTR